MTHELDKHRDYERIKIAIDFINDNPSADLANCATQLNLSTEHFQKLFSRWAGVSPKQYTQFLKKEYAINLLRSSSENLQTISDKSGLSGTVRLHDLIVNFYGMTPGEYASQGKNLSIDYGFHKTRFGDCLIANTDRGVCKLAFFDNETEKNLRLEELFQQWSLSTINENINSTQALCSRIFTIKKNKKEGPLKILVKGTSFQLKVWQALLRIPEGNLFSYQQIAKHINQANATRAVSSAIARNQIGLLIPCHRVIRQNGDFSQYRWGQTRKKAMIAWEASQA